MSYKSDVDLLKQMGIAFYDPELTLKIGPKVTEVLSYFPGFSNLSQGILKAIAAAFCASADNETGGWKVYREVGYDKSYDTLFDYCVKQWHYDKKNGNDGDADNAIKFRGTFAVQVTGKANFDNIWALFKRTCIATDAVPKEWRLRFLSAKSWDDFSSHDIDSMSKISAISIIGGICYIHQLTLSTLKAYAKIEENKYSDELSVVVTCVPVIIDSINKCQKRIVHKHYTIPSRQDLYSKAALIYKHVFNYNLKK
jgi:hypothetical protein